MIVVTLACILFGRVAYLQRMAGFHKAEALRFLREERELLPQLPPEFRNSMVTISFQLEPEVERECERLWSLVVRHQRLSQQYSDAVWKPWTIIDESTAENSP
jgi:hypothetical protein